MRAWDPYVMQMVDARQKHNAEGGREAKKFKNHWSRSKAKVKVEQKVKFT